MIVSDADVICGCGHLASVHTAEFGCTAEEDCCGVDEPCMCDLTQAEVME